MLGELSESNEAARRACHVCAGPILDGCGCEKQFAITGELGARLIRRERVRQVDLLSYTAGHDDQHDQNELSHAARAYLWHAITTAKTGRECISPPPGWPWLPDEFKQGNELAALVKAGALIAARIDQLARHHPELLG